MANGILNFEGGIGRDQFLSADGIEVNVLNQDDINRQFVMTITNTLAVKRDIFITPGADFSNFLQLLAAGKLNLVSTIAEKAVDGTNPAAAIDLAAALSYAAAPGYVLEGNFYGIDENSSTVAAPMSAYSSPRKIMEFFQYINSNPTTLTKLKINDSIGDGMQNNIPLEVFELSPFRQLASKVINPSFYITQNSMNQQNCLFDTPNVILSNQTKLKYSIAPAVSINGTLTPRTISIIFNCGVTLNTADALQNKVMDAKKLVAAKVISKM